MTWTERARLRDAHPRRVGGHEHRAVLDGLDAGEEQLDLAGVEDLGQRVRHAGPRDARGDLGPLERDGVEEGDRGDVHLPVGRAGAAIGEVDEEGSDLVLAHLAGRAAVEGDELAGAADVLLARHVAVPTKAEIGDHLVAQLSHDVLQGRRKWRLRTSIAGTTDDGSTDE